MFKQVAGYLTFKIYKITLDEYDLVHHKDL